MSKKKGKSQVTAVLLQRLLITHDLLHKPCWKRRTRDVHTPKKDPESVACWFRLSGSPSVPPTTDPGNNAKAPPRTHRSQKLAHHALTDTASTTLESRAALFQQHTHGDRVTPCNTRTWHDTIIPGSVWQAFVYSIVPKFLSSREAPNFHLPSPAPRQHPAQLQNSVQHKQNGLGAEGS
eukprot:2572990-Amphidinium_carterae.2